FRSEQAGDVPAVAALVRVLERVREGVEGRGRLLPDHGGLLIAGHRRDGVAGPVRVSRRGPSTRRRAKPPMVAPSRLAVARSRAQGAGDGKIAISPPYPPVTRYKRGNLRPSPPSRSPPSAARHLPRE